MKTRLLGMLFIILLALACLDRREGTVVTYPTIPELVTSDIYSVTVNEQQVWTEKFRTRMALDSLPDWFTSEPYTQVQQEVHIANFSGEGPLQIRIEVNEPIEQAAIRPKSRQLQPTIQGNRLEFTLPGPDKLYLEINHLPPLLFFANPIETEQPQPNDPGVRYFGPGVHRPGLMTLEAGESVYIAGGAIVYGGIRVKGTGNHRIFGRGILDGNFQFRRMVLLEDGRDIEFNGVIIRNGRTWTNTIVNCRQVRYQEVKVISFGPGGDGINPLGSQEVTIDHCFLRCTDDCIAIKSPDSSHVVSDVLVSNNTMVGFAFSDGVTIGFETNGPSVSGVTVRNCDILIARGGSRVDGHSAFSVICDGPAVIRKVLYENIRVEADVLKLFELHITDGTKYGVNPPGQIQEIHLKNIAWEVPRPIILHGFDETHLVRDVTFESCTIADEPLTEMRADVFQINPFVVGVRFK